MRIAIVLIFIGFSPTIPPAAAQWISFGVKGGGVPVGSTGFLNDSSPFVVGPSVEFRLPAGFAVETGALYQRLGSNARFVVLGDTPGAPTQFEQRVRGNSWQFPVLGKHYFRTRTAPWQPFVGAGFAFGTGWFHEQSASIGSGQNLALLPPRADYRSSTNLGAIVAAGVRYRIGRLALAPEVRYNYWGANSYPQRQNSASFLMGISF
jgi:Outer membrane protein beta-barrel domain